MTGAGHPLADEILNTIEGSANGNGPELAPATDWLTGSPMDPDAIPAEPLPALPGFPFMHRGMAVLIVGPTGGGRSSLIETGLYDAAKAGLRCCYLGHEITSDEFNARAALIARLRGDTVDDELRAQLARVRYVDLASTVIQAWGAPDAWVEGIVAAYDIVAFDPLSAVESALDLNFEQRNSHYVAFHDKLVKPVTAKGVTVALIDNIGHAIEARSRAKGASAKADRADLTFSCRLVPSPAALVVKLHKVRSVRTAHRHGDEWIFYRDSQTIERFTGGGDEDGDEDGFRPTGYMEKVSRFLEDEPDPQSLNAIKKTVRGKVDYVTKAVRCLVREEFVQRHDSGQSHRHSSLRPYRETDDQKRLSTDTRDAGTGTDRYPTGNNVQERLTDTRENPDTTGVGTGTQPIPDRYPRLVPDDRYPDTGVRSTRLSVSVGDEVDPDAEIERLTAKYGPAGFNDQGEEMPF